MFQESYMRKIYAAVGVMAVVALGAYAYSAWQQTRYMYQAPTSIAVTGKGEIVAKPDIATFTFTVNAKETDAVTAQNKISGTMDGIMGYLKGAGVDEKDVKTDSYNLSPWYEYPDRVCTMGYCPPQYSEPKLKGYEASQSVTVKVRDMAKAGEILSQIGTKGAQNVSGIQMTIDDVDTLHDQARALAIQDAQKKAEELAKNLNVRLVRMNGYWEDTAMPYGSGVGMGGSMMMDKASYAQPEAAVLPVGENTVTSNVNLSYEVR